MPTIQIRDLPEHLHYKLKEEAGKQHRSLSQQAIVVLSKGLGHYWTQGNMGGIWEYGDTMPNFTEFGIVSIYRYRLFFLLVAVQLGEMSVRQFSTGKQRPGNRRL